MFGSAIGRPQGCSNPPWSNPRSRPLNSGSYCAGSARSTLAEAERAGGTIKRPAGRAEWGGTTGAFADPDGYVWEVAHNPSWTLAENGAVTI